MKQYRWRALLIAGLTIWAAWGVTPSAIYFATPKEIRNSEEEMKKRIPKMFPEKHIKLGLDLQGGVQLVLGVNTDTAVDNKLSRMGTEAQRWAGDAKLQVESAYVLKGQQVLRMKLKPEQDIGDFKLAFKEEYPELSRFDEGDNTVDYRYADDQIKRIKESAIEQAERVIRNRVDRWGVAEPVINRRQADNSVLVQLPGFKDPSRAKELLGRTAQLAFKLVDDEFDIVAKAKEKGDLPAGINEGNNGRQTALLSEDRDGLEAYVASLGLPEDRSMHLQVTRELAEGTKREFQTYVTFAATQISGEDVLDAFVSQDSRGLDRQPVVSMKFSGSGGKRFGDITGENINKALAIVLDDMIESAPNIESKIANGQAIITMGTAGGFQKVYEEANELALILKSGALPATIEVLEERQVGASLGPELADQGIRGMLLGLILVLTFMLFYYRRPGLIACLALTLNAVFLASLMASFGFALTLPGIAGFILTLGMAVDANVLINERIRQELREGKNAKKAVESAFKKVFWTIVDANVTTLIAALVLLETNSSGPIRGFAVTLMIGLIVSMFTSLYCTRTFFEVVTSRFQTDSGIRAWLGGAAAIKDRNFKVNFLKSGKLAASIGAGLIILVAVLGGMRGVNWGVDFAGGTEMMLGFGVDTDSEEIKAVASKVGIKEMTLQALGGGKRQYLVRFGEQTNKGTQSERSAAESKRVQDFKEAFTTDLSAKNPELLQVDYVGPQIGKELRSQGVQSLFWAMLFVLLYIGLRFDMRFGPGAVAKMVQDMFIIFGFYIVFNRSFDLTSVAAFLTVVGYSVNDTIVIYDRIRENLSLHAKRPLFDNINFSLNETLSRTINTSVTTVLALIGVLVFGSGQIWNFAMAMTIGVVAATLSSQFLASSFVLWLENWRKDRKVAAS